MGKCTVVQRTEHACTVKKLFMFEVMCEMYLSFYCMFARLVWDLGPEASFERFGTILNSE